MDNNQLQLFENKEIRTIWDESEEEWYFSIVDVVGVLTNQETQRGASNYWAKLKQRLKAEGANQLLTNCQQLKMTSPFPLKSKKANSKRKSRRCWLFL